jgi:hypothetical protein
MTLRVGLDFDNTLAGYDDIFSQAARDGGLVPPDFSGTKQDVRALCRARPGGETEWMRLQGRVYGALMPQARMIDGADAFLERCRAERVQVFIVSHKTEYGHFDDDKVNLRDAARSWMDAKGFFETDRFGLSPTDVFFEPDRKSKVARIAEIGCSHFVDDLEEVFLEPGFPDATRRLLYTAGRDVPPGPYEAMADWASIGDSILGS